MAETPVGCLREGFVDGDELSQSVATSEDWSRSTTDDSDEQLSCSELNELQKESEMPLEDLLCMYGGGGPAPQPSLFIPKPAAGSTLPPDSPLNCCGRTAFLISEDEILKKCDLTLDKDEIARDLLLVGTGSGGTEMQDASTVISGFNVPCWQQNNLQAKAHHCPMDRRDSCTVTQSDERVKDDVSLPCPHNAAVGHDDDDDENDEDYLPENDSCCHQIIPVGSDHQAVLPDLASYSNTLSCETDERLLWDPSKLPESKVEKYCREVNRHTRLLTNAQPEIAAAANMDIVADDEQALYLLLQCGHNLHEALRRHHMQVVPPTDPLSLWSEEECTNFITGLRLYGKDFYLIQQHKVKTRSVGELIQFYYLWKKTEQYAAFVGKSYALRKYTQQLQRTASSGEASLLGSSQPCVVQQQASCDYLPVADGRAAFEDVCLSSTRSTAPATSLVWTGSPPTYDSTALPSFQPCNNGDLFQHSFQTSTSSAVYADSFPRTDLYYAPQFCAATSPRDGSTGFERPAKRFCSDVAGSPVVGHMASSGELPANARAYLYFSPDGPAPVFSQVGPSSSSYGSLLEHHVASDNLASGDVSSRGYGSSEMLAQ